MIVEAQGPGFAYCGEEQFRERRSPTVLSYVIEDGFGHRRVEWEGQRFAPFAGLKMNQPVMPVNVAQAHVRDSADANTVGGHYQKDGVIAPTGSGLAIGSGQ